MDFHVLGPVGATIGHRQVHLGTPRQRCVLAVLLVEAGSVVPTEQLIDRLWAQRPPREARSTLYSYVTRIRATLQSLGAAAEGVALVRQAGGYLLDVPPERVDLHRFRRLVKDGRAAGGERAGVLLRRALGLWKADALTGVSGVWVDRTRAQLDDERVMAYLAYLNSRIDLGRYEELLPDLRALVASHPFDERLAAQLMTVLERCGRQAEALRLYEEVRSQLAEQLGVDPGPELRRRHLELLSSAPVPAVPTAPVPRQLPPAPTGFQGRARELAELNRVGGKDDLIVALVGPGGVGKTCLALSWAHQCLDRFPDGQLYANLRGFSPAGEHLAPSTVLRNFLEALGAEPSAIPPGSDAREALYRSLVAGRRMLVVLDDVRDAAEVTPLLPGSPTCTVVLTSRHRLAGLSVAYGTRILPLDVLSPGEARRMLARRIGASRAETEAETVTSLLEYCGGLPLALGVLASRAMAHPEFSLSVLAEELKEESNRLDALDAGDSGTDVRAVFASSYRALPPIAARTFGLLGAVPGPSIGLPAVAALLGLPIPRARTVLRMLEAAHLVQQHAPSRYRMHDLVRLYAMEVADRDIPADVRKPALRRLIGFYLGSAHAADRLLYPHRVGIELTPPCGDSAPPPPMANTAQALAWWDTEYSGLLAAFRLAAAHGWDTATWQLAWVLDTYCLRRAHLADLVDIWMVASQAVERLADPLPRAVARWRLGFSRAVFGERDGVLDLLRGAVALFAQAGAAEWQAQVHQSLGWVMSRWKEHELALHHAEQALAMYQMFGNSNWEANALNGMAWCLSQLHRHDKALIHAEQALGLFRRSDDPDGEAAALDSMGHIIHHMGRYREAIGYYRSAIRKRVVIGNVTQEPDTLVRIGDSHEALGEILHARVAWKRALLLYRGQHRVSEAEQVQARLDGP